MNRGCIGIVKLNEDVLFVLEGKSEVQLGGVCGEREAGRAVGDVDWWDTILWNGFRDAVALEDCSRIWDVLVDGWCSRVLGIWSILWKLIVVWCYLAILLLSLDIGWLGWSRAGLRGLTSSRC